MSYKPNSEKFINTYSPDYLTWLSPKVTYNPVYLWSLTSQNDTLPLASISVTAPWKTSVNITPKEIIEMFYSPSGGSGSSSSRRRGRGSSSSSNKSKIYEFESPPKITANFITHNIDYDKKTELSFTPLNQLLIKNKILKKKYFEGIHGKIIYPQLHGYCHYNIDK